MAIQSSELLNLLMTIVLLIVAWRQENGIMLLILFIYGSLYYCASLAPFFAGWPVVRLTDFHRFHGSGLLAKSSAAVFLAVLFARLGCRTGKLADWDRQFLYLFLAVIAAVFLGYLLRLRPGDWQQLQNIISIELMLLLMFLGYSGLRAGKVTALPGPLPWGIIKGISLAALLVGFYEVYSLRAWANFADSDGELIFRASSMLYNPNLFGIWGAIITLGLAFAMHQGIGSRLNLSLWLLVSSAGVMLSGSRSAILLLLISLGLAATFLGQMNLGRRCQPLLLVLLAFMGFSAGSRFFEWAGIGGQDGWHAIKLLTDRAWSAPLLLARYFLYSSEAVPAEVAIAIEGRFSGGMKDSGLFLLYDDAGWLGVGFMALLCLTFAVIGIQAHRRKRDAASSYALALLFFCAAVGLVIRYQVFPVWLFVGAIIPPCLVLWRNDQARTRYRPEKLSQ